LNLVFHPFTRSKATHPFPQAMLAMLLVGVDVGGSSVNMALRDFQYTARSYVVTLAAIAAYFLAARRWDWGLGGVWWGLALFFGVRSVQSLGRAAWRLRSGGLAEVEREVSPAMQAGGAGNNGNEEEKEGQDVGTVLQATVAASDWEGGEVEGGRRGHVVRENSTEECDRRQTGDRGVVVEAGVHASLSPG
jgi:hypothetical protein